MIFPDSFERKIGFDLVRQHLSELCVCRGTETFVTGMNFTHDFELILMLVSQTDEMKRLLEASEPIGIIAISPFDEQLSKLNISGYYLTEKELFELGKILRFASSTQSFFVNKTNDAGESLFPNLQILISRLDPLTSVDKAIERILDKFGNIRDNASPELAQIRKELQQLSGRISSIMKRVLSKAVSEGVLEPDTNPSMRDGRLVIPVQPMHKRSIPGIVHDESSSGKTYFIEPAEIVEANNHIRELQLEEKREIIRILTQVTDEIRPFAESIATDIDVLYNLDFIQAKAKYAIKLGCTKPHLSQNTEMEWYHAIHPVLQLALNRHGKEMTALDIKLNGKNRILLISGPNAGGKSVCLKTVGIVQYMLQCGMLPPVYENSHLGIFESIFIDIGDDQSIEDDLSTYSSHLKNMKFFVNNCNDKTLLLIDEFGGGTEPQIGGAIAQAILKNVNDKKSWGVITTHFQNLKQFGEETSGIINGSMLYDKQQMRPLFKLSIGHPGSSFAIEIARKIGLPLSIITDAQEIAGSDYVNIEKYLSNILRDKKYWENKRLEIKKKEKQIDEVLAKYEDAASTLSEQRKAIISQAKEEAKEILAQSNAAIERTIHEIRRAQAEKTATIEARKALEQEKSNLIKEKKSDEHPLLKKVPNKKKKEATTSVKSIPVEIKVGDNVKLDGEGTVGTVVEINGNNATVVFGSLKTTVNIKRLKYTSAKVQNKSPKVSVQTVSDTSRKRLLNFNNEIDVRGMRAEEALQAVTYFIDDAVQFNASRIRILHGTGTGVLRQVIRQYLGTIPYVKSYSDEDVRFGGAGITVIEMN